MTTTSAPQPALVRGEWQYLALVHGAASEPFWAAIGADVPGSYRQRPPHPHVTRG
jgi:hypothetical protein